MLITNTYRLLMLITNTYRLLMLITTTYRLLMLITTTYRLLMLIVEGQYTKTRLALPLLEEPFVLLIPTG